MAVRRHAEIAGGGFAGLVAAIALAQRGWTVRVHVMGEALRAFGAGIFIWENGLRVLKAIGAYDEVMAGSHEGRVYEVRDRNEVVDRTEFSAELGGRMMTMTRQTLYSAILAVAESEDIEFVLDSEVTGASPDGELRTRDGGRFRADLVVGADGVMSRLQPPPIFTKRARSCTAAFRLTLIKSLRAVGLRQAHGRYGSEQ